MAGSAIKFCRVAEGGADIYPRLAPTCEWDVAAGHAVVTAAGGKVTDSTGAALRFGAGRKDFIVPEFIAWGDPAGGAMTFYRASVSFKPGQRCFASRMTRAGSAAKASRLSARPNRNSRCPRISQNRGLPAKGTPRATSVGS